MNPVAHCSRFCQEQQWFVGQVFNLSLQITNQSYGLFRGGLAKELQKEERDALLFTHAKFKLPAFIVQRAYAP
jgi:hypothetical protein